MYYEHLSSYQVKELFVCLIKETFTKILRNPCKETANTANPVCLNKFGEFQIHLQYILLLGIIKGTAAFTFIKYQVVFKRYIT